MRLVKSLKVNLYVRGELCSHIGRYDLHPSVVRLNTSSFCCSKVVIIRERFIEIYARTKESVRINRYKRQDMYFSSSDL